MLGQSTWLDCIRRDLIAGGGFRRPMEEYGLRGVIKIATIFNKIAGDLATHLCEEEEVFFPAIKRADATPKAGTTPEAKDIETIKNSLKKLRHDHEEIGNAMHTIRHLA